MSITKRIFDVARSNLNTLLDKAADAADPRRRLDGFSDDELAQELARRKDAALAERRVSAARDKVDAPATGAAASNGAAAAGGGATGAASTPRKGSPEADRATREAAAKDREARVRAVREARERAAREAGKGAGDKQRAQQQRAQGGGASAPRAARGSDALMAQFFKRLELPTTASFDEVKSQYRKLMRRYHPDLHAQTPEKLKAANEVAAALTQAYNELEKHLLGGPNRK